ncbi:hypothetical protein DH2020_027970 [Rehmannia glutinosa]|uniref:Uncharacterized protein n=1 Tax=Rehmannia glutinosa TaxID=99300 RepID=A0ABR0VTN0_REHGL
MAPASPRQILPLLFFILISFSCLLLFSLSSSNSKARIQTQFPQIQSPNPGPGFTFIIKVLTFNRLSSLSRCLNSLSKAHYDAGDKVHLHVFIDHFQQDSGKSDSADLDQRLNLSKQIVDFVDGFDWKFGEKLVHYRTSNAGLQAQWLEAWWPTSDHEFAFVVEDDLEVTTGWYKKMGEKIWTPWFIKFIQSRGYFNIYTNFHHERALSISHRDAGVNYGKTAGPDSYLLDENSIDFNLLELYPLNSLKWYDFCFREVLTNRIVRSSNDLESVLQSVQKNNSVVVVNLYRKPEKIVRNILCHFERLNIRNYILIGPTSHFLLDLARRGNPVIDASQFSDFSQLSKSINFQDSTLDLIKEILVKAYATKKSLELGYSTWLLDANTLPISGDPFFDSFGHSNDFYIGKNTNLLFVRSSSSTLKIWADDFVYNVASVVDTLTKESVSHDSLVYYAIEKLLEKQNIKFSSVDDMQLASDISTVHANQTSFEMKNKFIFWSSETELDIIQKQLVHLDMWVVDSDFSCTSVVCHQS